MKRRYIDNHYMNLLPKDVWRIIYSYLYAEVPQMLYRYVVKFNNVNSPKQIYLPNMLYQNSSLVKSTKCRICRKLPPEKLCVWLREYPKDYTSEYMRLLFDGNGSSNICTALIKSHDVSAVWNDGYKYKHRFSIIDGVVYHLTQSEESDKRYRLVPYFQSDHCWQDIGMRLMRNINKMESTSEYDECIRKQNIPTKDKSCIIS